MDDYDSMRVHQAQNMPDQQHRIPHHRDGEPSGPPRSGVRIVVAFLAVIVMVFVVMLLVDPGGSDDPNGAVIAMRAPSVSPSG